MKKLSVEGKYFSTYAFVQQNKLEKIATKVLGKGWEAEDDVSQIQSIIDELKIGRHLVEYANNSEDIVVTDISNDNEISVPIMYYIDDNGNKVYDFEEMANHFEQELSKLDDSVVVMCSIQ